ncbi:hypothetical protein [Streptomyces sp. NPDC127105]|uniref:hypothetical protein n=1 Tax=Streptomyces sp. NPDC127105 TaxID=3345359 RepID=UPI003666C59F
MQFWGLLLHLLCTLHGLPAAFAPTGVKAIPVLGPALTERESPQEEGRVPE